MWRLSITDNGIGEIQIDDFKESFLPDLSYWSRADYERHWYRAAKAIDEGLPVIFITSITDPASSHFFRAWACYPMEGELVFQEQILFLKELDRPFNLEKPHSNVLSYDSITEDGEQISEWRTRFEN